MRFNALFLVLAAVVLILLKLFWNATIIEKERISSELGSSQSFYNSTILIPYHHVIDQFEWVTEIATNKVCCIVLVCYPFFNNCARIRDSLMPGSF